VQISRCPFCAKEPAGIVATGVGAGACVAVGTTVAAGAWVAGATVAGATVAGAAVAGAGAVVATAGAQAARTMEASNTILNIRAIFIFFSFGLFRLAFFLQIDWSWVKVAWDYMLTK
jgi:hypothetical protein